MPKTSEVKLSPFYMEARALPESVNEGDRTVTVTYASEIKVLRFDYCGGREYNEVLSTKKGHVRLDRINSGANLVDTHNTASVTNVFGVIEKADETTAIIRFAKDERSEEVFQKIKDGILTKVSVGYRVFKFVITEEDGEIPEYRAVDWEPTEISLVSVPADINASVRSSENEDAKNICVIENPNAASRGISQIRKEETMPDKIKQGEVEKTLVETRAAATPAPAPEVNVNEIRAQETQRCQEIFTMARTHELGNEWADTQIKDGVSLDTARARALDVISAQSEAVETRSTVKVGQDNSRQMMIEGMENALRSQTMSSGIELSENDRRFMGMGICDMVRELTGERTYDRQTLVRAAMATTSDFPIILSNVMNKNLVEMFETTERTFTHFAKKTSYRDFKPTQNVQFARGFDMQKINENGEYNFGKFVESVESSKLETYAIAYAVTRQAIINDDIGVLEAIPEDIKNAAASKESDEFYNNFFINNVALSDGKAFFHTGHKNKGTLALSLAGLTAGRKALRQQKALGGKRRTPYTAKFLLVGTELETTADQLTDAIAATKSDDVNPFASNKRNRLEVIVEPRFDDISATAWALVADPNQVQSFQYGYLQGQEGPVLERNEKLNIDGVGFVGRHDFATGARSYQGAYFSTGAAE